MTDISGRIKEASSSMRDQAEQAAESVRSSVARSADQAGGAFAAAERAGSAVLGSSGSVGEAVKASIERQPLTAVAVAAVVGFVFGVFFFRRS